MKKGGIEEGQQQINNGNREVDAAPPPLHPCQAQRKCAQPRSVGGGQVPHQPACLAGRVR
jgi:hypothetical protein